ncbi:MAG: lecithin retinol acyltransferase family protein [Chitinophagales bacterium]|nr:lecithin retinol acyltransferase family protein [Chitinophagales bacterium]
MTTLNLACNWQQTQALQAFIYQYHLQPGDAIIVKEHDKGFVRSLLDHYVIYLGDTLFMANYRDGVKILDCPTIFRFLPSMKVDRIRRFTGSDQERWTAIQRAFAQRDRESYHLIADNCEHFANEVQYGIAYSDQALTGGTAATFIGIGMMSSRNSLVQLIGGLLTIAGGAVTVAEVMRRMEA